MTATIRVGEAPYGVVGGAGSMWVVSQNQVSRIESSVSQCVAPALRVTDAGQITVDAVVSVAEG